MPVAWAAQVVAEALRARGRPLVVGQGRPGSPGVHERHERRAWRVGRGLIDTCPPAAPGTLQSCDGPAGLPARQPSRGEVPRTVTALQRPWRGPRARVDEATAHSPGPTLEFDHAPLAIRGRSCPTTSGRPRARKASAATCAAHAPPASAYLNFTGGEGQACGERSQSGKRSYERLTRVKPSWYTRTSFRPAATGAPPLRPPGTGRRPPADRAPTTRPG